MSLLSHRIERRRRYRAAVLPKIREQRPSADAVTVRAVTGLICDASPHLLVVAVPGPPAGRGADPLRRAGPTVTEVRLAMTPDTSVWYGGDSGLEALRPGREVVVRPLADGMGVDRIWVDITRVTGTILHCGRTHVEVDAGPHRRRVVLHIPKPAMGRILVRHPRLQPGYLIDVIATRSQDGPVAVVPGTSQPGYRADALTPPEVTGPLPARFHGTATWFAESESHGDAPSRGLAYPAVDSEGAAGGCADAPPGCTGLPLLSLGSDLLVRNECSSLADVMPVVECGCVAARYCDRCVECGTSPRGRIAELTRASFVDLGGDLAVGCFNATIAPTEVSGP